MSERLSLIARSGALKRARRQRGASRPVRQRYRALVIMATGLALLGVGAFTDPSPWLVWNASASVPRGLYLRDSQGFARGDLVLARLPDEVRGFAATRGYLPEDVPLVKRVAALQGDTVCVIANDIFVNGKDVARRRGRDGQGRPMPESQGCERLGTNDVFLLMQDVPESFDGRYFGPIDRALVIGRLEPLWTF